jgi:23S rRNA (cytidine1920-2'-O)/16S rRNA (cytidine1409-2'-O)-methyltransferase
MARRRLDAELVHRKLFTSRSAAQAAITANLVEVDGMVVTKSASQVDPGASIRLVGEQSKYVSRGGMKLEAALDSFAIEVAGKNTIDVGASTGGFTDCLLQRGAAHVCAVDVGYGQLDWRIRQDERVAVFERLNARYLDVAEVGGPFDLVVADLSFISLRTMRESLVGAGTVTADWVLLVKPQFEAGKDQVGKGGIVRDVAVRRRALLAVIDSYAESGVGVRGLIDSPISGAKGNREFLLWLRRGPGELPAGTLDNLGGLQDD